MRGIFSAVMIAAFILPALPAAADPPSWAPANGRRAKDAYDGGPERRAVRYDEMVYRGDDGRYYCRRSDGTTGLIVRAAVGGVLGDSLARGKSAPLGALLGAGAGALIGQAVDRGSVYCE